MNVPTPYEARSAVANARQHGSEPDAIAAAEAQLDRANLHAAVRRALDAAKQKPVPLVVRAEVAAILLGDQR